MSNEDNQIEIRIQDTISIRKVANRKLENALWGLSPF